ncbi:MAG: type I DNA topoisomerase [Dehalococcoidia bacterium]|nr:type I DNA topoisomerase [Dehalococcoidia bacterium]
MSTKLVIVESPAKARTLNKILGRSYAIKASLGHVRDLPKSSLGVTVEKDFAPKYVVPLQKRKVIKEIREAASKASSIYLATDPDREGEAISWHLVQAAKLDKNDVPIYRIGFHEITEGAVKGAFENPRSIDMNLVNAQQTRRILDRLVGYKLSPLLWKKVQRGLSAGRVQSVTVKIVVDREREIQNFIPQEYWVIEVELAPPEGKGVSFKARLQGLIDGTKLDVCEKREADDIVAYLEKAEYIVKSIQTKNLARRPAPPFITSTLQQEAWRKLHFTAKRTMVIAQQLYEGLPLAKEGSVGLITYMRTDSTNVAATALAEARDFISERYGSDFLPSKPRSFARKAKWAQEAHEAIRPTKIYREPGQIKAFLKPDQLKLYELIWKRMTASQMASVSYDMTNVEIEARNVNYEPATRRPQGYLLKAVSSVVKSPGFMVVYSESKDEDEQGENFVSLPELVDSNSLICLKVFPQQHFTQPPPRYSEATLIKALEQKGIGRPSTYAPIISTIQERDYVHKVDGKLCPDEVGIVVNDILNKHFPRIVDLGFTAQMEKQLDKIAQGRQEWVAVLRDFYSPFEDTLRKASANIVKIDISKATDETCPNCGRTMVIKVGRFGKFLACSGYPECKTTMPYMVKTGVLCPQCDGELVKRVNKKKRVFYGCSNFPKCQFTTSYQPIAEPCPQCGKLLVLSGKSWVKCIACGYKARVAEMESIKQSGTDTITGHIVPEQSSEIAMVSSQ